MAYFKKIIGDKCYLSPATPDDAPVYTEWMNDLEIGLTMNVIHQNISEKKQKEWLSDLSPSNNQVYSIIDKQSNVIIGNCGLYNIDTVNSRAVFGIFIGDKSKWGQGFGQEATRLILDFGFNILNLNSINLGVCEFNKQAIRAYEKVGFQHAGKYREATIIAGKKYDAIIMDILASEFESIYVKKLMDEY